MDLVLRGGTIVPIVPGRESFSGDVLVRGTHIAAIGPDVARHIQRPANVVELHGAAVLPGFVQTHVRLSHSLHAGINGSDPLALLRSMSAEMLRAAARLGLAQLLLGGTTTALDAGVPRFADAVFEAGRDLGARLFTGLLTAPLPSASGKRDTFRAALSEAEKLRKLWNGAGEGRLHYAYLPGHVLACDEDLLVEVVGRARGGGCLLHCSAAPTPADLEQLRARFGSDTMLHLHEAGLTGRDVVLAHCVGLTAREQKLLRESATRISHSPAAELRAGMGLAKLPEWLQHGLHLSLGSAGADVGGGHDLLETLRLIALLHRVRGGDAPLDAWQLLEMATLRGAEALGLDAEIGSLEPGKRADLVVVDLSGPHVRAAADAAEALVFRSRSSDVRHVLVDGEFLVRDRQLTRIDQQLIGEDAERARTVLRRKFK